MIRILLFFKLEIRKDVSGTLVSTNDKSTVKYISKMSKYIILFIFYFVSQISAKEGLDVFQKFKSDFGRQYATEEEESVK